jgi:hypothetical protein
LNPAKTLQHRAQAAVVQLLSVIRTVMNAKPQPQRVGVLVRFLGVLIENI